VKTTPATEKVGLGTAIAPVGIAALVAPLGSMPGVNSHDLATEGFSLILKESLELGKAPSVEPPLGFPPAGFDTTPDVGEVFHDDSRTGLNAIEDRGRQHVVAIPSEALFTPSEASKVPSGTLSTFGLQSTSEAKYSLGDFFHMPVPMKTVVGGNGRPGNSQINTDSLSITNESNVRQSDDSVQVEIPLAINKVGGSRRIARRILGIFRKVERYPHPTVRGRQADNALIPVYFKGVQVVPGRTGHRLRTAYLASLLHLGDSRPHGFTGFVYRLNVQVRDKSRQSILTIAVNKSLECVVIASSLLPPLVTNSIEYLGKLANRLMQGFSLFIIGLKLYSYRSIHTGIIPHTAKILQIKGKEVCRNSSVS